MLSQLSNTMLTWHMLVTVLYKAYNLMLSMLSISFIFPLFVFISFQFTSPQFEVDHQFPSPCVEPLFFHNGTHHNTHTQCGFQMPFPLRVAQKMLRLSCNIKNLFLLQYLVIIRLYRFFQHMTQLKIFLSFSKQLQNGSGVMSETRTLFFKKGSK